MESVKLWLSRIKICGEKWGENIYIQVDDDWLGDVGIDLK